MNPKLIVKLMQILSSIEKIFAGVIWIRNIIISCLIGTTLTTSLLVPLIYLDFEVRKSYIEQVLCIERDLPITTCKGSCILDSRLDLAGKQQKQDEGQSKLIELIFFIKDLSEKASALCWSVKPVTFIFSYLSPYESHVTTIFRPPIMRTTYSTMGI